MSPPDKRDDPRDDKTYDQRYFDHWYRRAGIGGAQRLKRKVALAVATAEYHLERPIRTVLDIGCGEGAWRAPLLALRPKAQYLGFDSSEYAIRRYGARRNLRLQLREAERNRRLDLLREVEVLPCGVGKEGVDEMEATQVVAGAGGHGRKNH